MGSAESTSRLMLTVTVSGTLWAVTMLCRPVLALVAGSCATISGVLSIVDWSHIFSVVGWAGSEVMVRVLSFTGFEAGSAPPVRRGHGCQSDRSTWSGCTCENQSRRENSLGGLRTYRESRFSAAALSGLYSGVSRARAW
jgi:hypothetical protein